MDKLGNSLELVISWDWTGDVDKYLRGKDGLGPLLDRRLHDSLTMSLAESLGPLLNSLKTEAYLSPVLALVR